MLRGTQLRTRYFHDVRRQEKIPRIGPYLVAQCVVGGLTGLGWGLLILATDTAGLTGLVRTSSTPGATCVLFLLGSVIVFLPVVLATAIGALAQKTSEDPSD